MWVLVLICFSPVLSAPRGMMTSANFLVCKDEICIDKDPNGALNSLPASKIPRRLASQTSCTGWAQRPDPCHAHWCHVELKDQGDESLSYSNHPTYLFEQAAYPNQYPRKASCEIDHVFWENKIPRCPQKAPHLQDRWPACSQSHYKQRNCIGMYIYI